MLIKWAKICRGKHWGHHLTTRFQVWWVQFFFFLPEMWVIMLHNIFITLRCMDWRVMIVNLIDCVQICFMFKWVDDCIPSTLIMSWPSKFKWWIFVFMLSYLLFIKFKVGESKAHNFFTYSFFFTVFKFWEFKRSNL